MLGSGGFCTEESTVAGGRVGGEQLMSTFRHDFGDCTPNVSITKAKSQSASED